MKLPSMKASNSLQADRSKCLSARLRWQYCNLGNWIDLGPKFYLKSDLNRLLINIFDPNSWNLINSSWQIWLFRFRLYRKCWERSKIDQKWLIYINFINIYWLFWLTWTFYDLLINFFEILINFFYLSINFLDLLFNIKVIFFNFFIENKLNLVKFD